MRKDIYIYIQGNRTPGYDVCTRNNGRNIKTRQMLEANEMKAVRKTVGKTKIDRIRSQQIRESCGIQPIDEWWKEEEENGTNM